MDPQQRRKLAEIAQRAKLARARQARHEADRQAAAQRTARGKKEMKAAWLLVAAMMERVMASLNYELKNSGVTINFAVAKTSRVAQLVGAIAAFRFTVWGPDFSGELCGEVGLDGVVRHEEIVTGHPTREEDFALTELDVALVERMLIDFIGRAQSASESRSEHLLTQQLLEAVLEDADTF
jgi:hypothetical protein